MTHNLVHNFAIRPRSNYFIPRSNSFVPWSNYFIPRSNSFIPRSNSFIPWLNLINFSIPYNQPIICLRIMFSQRSCVYKVYIIRWLVSYIRVMGLLCPPPPPLPCLLIRSGSRYLSYFILIYEYMYSRLQLDIINSSVIL